MEQTERLPYYLPIEDISKLQDTDLVSFTWLIGDEEEHFLHDEEIVGEEYGNVKTKENVVICALVKYMEVVPATKESCKRYDLMYDISQQKFFNLLSIGARKFAFNEEIAFRPEVQDTNYGMHVLHYCYKVIKNNGI